MRRATIGTLLVLGLLTLSACAGTPAQPTSELPKITNSPAVTGSVRASAEAGPLAGSELVGTFETVVTANEFDTPVGDWQLTIDEESVAFVQPDGFEFSPGDVESVSGSKIVFAPDPACPTQEGDATEGRYQWAIEGAGLVITEVEDSCRDRAHLLTQGPWQVVP